MVSEQRAKDIKGGSSMDQRSIIKKGSCSQRDSRSPLEHAKMQREHDIKVLKYRLEEDLTWFIDSGSSAHMTGVREFFSIYQEEQMNFQITMGIKAKCTPIKRGIVTFQKIGRASCRERVSSPV